MTPQNYSVALDQHTRQIVVTAHEGASARYPYPHRTISEMDAHAAVKRFHTKRQAAEAAMFASLAPKAMTQQQAIDSACDFIQREMPIGQITITT